MALSPPTAVDLITQKHKKDSTYKRTGAVNGNAQLMVTLSESNTFKLTFKLNAK